MRRIEKLMTGWNFTDRPGNKQTIELPHTWNSKDGQDGGNNYARGTCLYDTKFSMPQYDVEEERVYLQFHGVNASAKVILNDKVVICHDGGYSTFRVDVTEQLQRMNQVVVEVDNSVNDRVYPQKADFTFYGGIYRDVELLIVNRTHFDLNYYGGPGIKYTTTVEGADATVSVTTYLNEVAKAENVRVETELVDSNGDVVAKAEGEEVLLTVTDAHLWDGLEDPYLYQLRATMYRGEEKVDEVSCNCGIRYFEFSPKDGFHLNGRPYPLHGVS